MSRPPDRSETWADDVVALTWANMGVELVKQFLNVVGVEITDEHLEDALEAQRRDLGTDERDIEAWIVDLEAATTTVEEMATVRMWVLHGPLHPMMKWFAVAAIHLRPIPGTPAPKIMVQGATHELMMVGYAPRPGVEMSVELIEDPGDFPGMIVPEIVHQVAGLSDEQMAELVDLAVGAILEGQMGTDRDYRQRWERLLDRTAEHIRFGTHPEFN